MKLSVFFLGEKKQTNKLKCFKIRLKLLKVLKVLCKIWRKKSYTYVLNRISDALKYAIKCIFKPLHIQILAWFVLMLALRFNIITPKNRLNFGWNVKSYNNKPTLTRIVESKKNEPQL